MTVYEFINRFRSGRLVPHPEYGYLWLKLVESWGHSYVLYVHFAESLDHYQVQTISKEIVFQAQSLYDMFISFLSLACKAGIHYQNETAMRNGDGVFIEDWIGEFPMQWTTLHVNFFSKQIEYVVKENVLCRT